MIKHDRRAVCREARRQFENSQRWQTGLTWADCMKRAWSIQKRRYADHEIRIQFKAIKKQMALLLAA